MTEQANVQKRSKKTLNNAPAPEMPQVQQIMAVIVPVEIFEQMKRCVRMQPYDEVELLMQTMRNLQPQTVSMQQGPGPG
jgi:hypothetical protein